MKGAVSYALGNGLTRADVMKKTRNFCGSEYIRVMEEQDSEDEGSRNDSSEESGEEVGVSDDERGQDTPSPKKRRLIVMQTQQGRPQKEMRVRRLPQRQPQKAHEGMHKVKKSM